MSAEQKSLNVSELIKWLQFVGIIAVVIAAHFDQKNQIQLLAQKQKYDNDAIVLRIEALESGSQQSRKRQDEIETYIVRIDAVLPDKLKIKK